MMQGRNFLIYKVLQEDVYLLKALVCSQYYLLVINLRSKLILKQSYHDITACCTSSQRPDILASDGCL